MMFDPKQHRESRARREREGGKGRGGGGGKRDLGVPGGVYLTAMVWFERRPTKAGDGDYLRAKFTICAGSQSDRGFFANVSLNTSKPGSAGRLAVYCGAVGDESPLDVEDDEALRKRFVFRPFKAQVTAVRKETESWSGIENDIQRILPKLTDAERRAADAWIARQGGDADLAEPLDGGGGDDPNAGVDEDDPVWGKSGGAHVEEPKEVHGGGGGSDDDSIPF
jgi:hypothetical protein